MDYLEIIGTAIGLIYLFLEYKASVWLWVAGIVMPVVYMFVYYDAGLYADMGISIYYLLASVYGLVCWWKGKGNSGSDKGNTDNDAGEGITKLPRNLIPGLILAVVLLEVVIGSILMEFTDSTVPWADGLTTALCIVAMWMLAKKYVEQWLLWILADIGCSMLYIYKDLYFTAGLYALYAAIAVAGYRKWIRMMHADDENNI